MTDHTVAVIPEAEALDNAYSAGFDRFEEAPADENGDPLEALSHFKESATWANSLAPRLRALSGYVDSGHGTYRVERQTVVVPEGDGDDLPRNAVRMDPTYVHEAIVRAFDRGALDAMEGADRGATAQEVSIT